MSEKPSILENLGIPEKAVRVYLALLGKPKMSIAEIVSETGIKRATCYEQIDLLLQKGLALRIPIGKRLCYGAVKPAKVLADFKKNTEDLERELSRLSLLHDQAMNKPKVAFYEGKREIKTIYRELFKTVGDTYSLFPAAAFFENFSEEDYDEFDKLVSGHSFASRDLFIADKFYKRIEAIRRANPADQKSGKKLPAWFGSNIDLLIFSDKVALISLRDLSAVVIENKDIAELFRNMHSFIWKAL